MRLFLYANEMPGGFWTAPVSGPGGQRDHHVIRGLELSAHSPTSREGGVLTLS